MRKYACVSACVRACMADVRERVRVRTRARIRACMHHGVHHGERKRDGMHHGVRDGVRACTLSEMEVRVEFKQTALLKRAPSALTFRISACSGTANSIPTVRKQTRG